MDFSKLSEETMAISQKIGDKQRQLLFDQNFFSDDCSIESVIHDEVTPEAGIYFGIDTSLGSFCLRGVPIENFNEEKKRIDELIQANSQLRKIKDGKLEFFPCESFELAQVICDTMMNRRFPFEEDSLCNISDPGPSWWLERGDRHLRIYFKSMGKSKDVKEKIGPIGDTEVTKKRWEQVTETLMSVYPGLNCEVSENGVFLAISSHEAPETSFLNHLSDFIIDGEVNKSLFQNLPKNYNSKIFKLYLTELAACRKFWIKVESLILNNA